MSTLEAVKRLILVSRPLGWIPTVSLFVTGFLLSGTHLTWAVWVGASLYVLPICIFVYGLNDIADRESDAVNARKGKKQGVRAVEADAALLKWAVMVSGAAPLVVFAAAGRYLEVISLLALLAFGYAYSMQPLRLKVRPVIDSLSNGWAVTWILLSGFFINSTNVRDLWPHPKTLVVLFLAAAAGHGWTAVVDYEADKKAGDTTLAVWLGRRPTLLVSAFLFGICLAVVASTPLQIFFGYCVLATLLFCWKPVTKVGYFLAFGAVMLIPVLVFYLALFGL